MIHTAAASAYNISHAHTALGRRENIYYQTKGEMNFCTVFSLRIFSITTKRTATNTVFSTHDQLSNSIDHFVIRDHDHADDNYDVDDEALC